MTVYVDDMEAQFGRMTMCHMIADTVAELHEMADTIGMRRSWFQDKESGPHYDLSKSKRAAAIRAGAMEITWRQCGIMCAIWRYTGTMGKPDTTWDEVLREREAFDKRLYVDRRAQELM